MHIAPDLKIHEDNLYDKTMTNSWEWAEENELSYDDSEFVDLNNFGDEWNTQPYIHEKHLLYLRKGEKTLEFAKKVEISTENTKNDNDLALSLEPNNIESLNPKSGSSTWLLEQNPAPPILYLR